MRVCVVLLASWLCWTSQALLVPLRPSPRTGARCLRAAVEELPLPPGKLGLPLLGDKTFPFTKTGSQYLEEQHLKWGPIFQQRLLFTKCIVVTGADALRQLWLGEHNIVEAEVPAPFAPLLGEKGIFMTKGDAHKKLKTQLARGFSPLAVGGYLPQMQSLAEEFFASRAKSGDSILGVATAKDFAFAIILETVMGLPRSMWASNDRISQLYRQCQAAMFAPPINLPGMTFRKALKARQEILAELDKVLSSDEMAIKAEEGIEGKAKNVIAVLRNAVDETGEKLSSDQIKDISFNMLDAGMETTGCTLAALLSALARDPVSMKALRDEQEVIIKKHGRQLTSVALQEMTFADAAIKEILRNASPSSDRMRSITVIGVKKALKSFELGGYQIPAGYTIITNSAFLNQHDSRWEGESPESPKAPQKFCPMRWLSGTGSGSGSGSGSDGEFMPFATGPRACIGSSLAIAELKVALAVLSRDYSWELLTADPNPGAGWKSDPFPAPSDGLPLRFKRM